jgi:hypothetical protein
LENLYPFGEVQARGAMRLGCCRFTFLGKALSVSRNHRHGSIPNGTPRREAGQDRQGSPDAIGAEEQPILATDRVRLDRPLGDIVVDRQAAVTNTGVFGIAGIAVKLQIALVSL